MKRYRIAAAILAWSALALQYYVLAAPREGAALVEVSVNFLSYFTIWANLLAALALTAPAAAPASRIGAWWAGETVRSGVALYVVVTMVVYHTVLATLWAPTGLQWIADVALHYGVPVVFLIDWLVFVPKGRLAWRAPIAWLTVPLVYGLFALARGAVSGFYAYPFLDGSFLGYGRVALNLAGLLLGFGVAGIVLVMADRILGRRRRPG